MTALIKDISFSKVVSRVKKILNYLEKLFKNEERKMNAVYSAIAGRGS
jgi:hypothetical protein